MRDLALLGVVLVWGFNYVPLKVALRELDAGVFTLLRFLGATPFLFLLLARTRADWRLPRADWLRVAAVGLFGTTLYQTVFAVASHLTTATNVSLLMALSPVFTVLLEWTGGGADGRRRTTDAVTAAGIAVALGGAALVIGGGSRSIAFSVATLKGDLVALLASFLWGAYPVVAGPLLARHSGLKVTAWTSLVGALGLLAVYGAGTAHVAWAQVSWSAWGGLLYSVVLTTVFALVVWYSSINHIGPTKVMAYMFLIPAAAIASGVAFLGERLTLGKAVGALLAIGGVYLIRRPRRTALAAGQPATD